MLNFSGVIFPTWSGNNSSVQWFDSNPPGHPTKNNKQQCIKKQISNHRIHRYTLEVQKKHLFSKKTRAYIFQGIYVSIKKSKRQLCLGTGWGNCDRELSWNSKQPIFKWMENGETTTRWWQLKYFLFSSRTLGK